MLDSSSTANDWTRLTESQNTKEINIPYNESLVLVDALLCIGLSFKKKAHMAHNGARTKSSRRASTTIALFLLL